MELVLFSINKISIVQDNLTFFKVRMKYEINYREIPEMISYFKFEFQNKLL